jgi:hypothetical protein
MCPYPERALVRTDSDNLLGEGRRLSQKSDRRSMVPSSVVIKQMNKGKKEGRAC